MIKIYTLVEARRILRRIRANNEKITDVLAKYKASQSLDTLHKDLVTLSRYLQTVQHNKELLKAVHIALETHLCETTNLVERLKKVTRSMDNKNQNHMQDLEDKLSHLSTHFDTKLNLLLKDLLKRFEKDATYMASCNLVTNNAGQEFGVLCLKNNRGKAAFCLIHCDDMVLDNQDSIQAVGQNQYKIFFNELPVDPVLENFHGFLSPSKALTGIMKQLQKDGF